MDDGLAMCAAAFMRNKGKDVFAENDILMGMSMDLRWMSHSEAKAVLSAMIRDGVLVKSSGVYRPAPDFPVLDIPVAYRPPRDLIERALKPSETPAEVPAEQREHVDVMPMLMEAAESAGMKRRDLISKSNQICRDMGIHIETAALIVLRDAGVDITELAGKVRESIVSR